MSYLITARPKSRFHTRNESIDGGLLNRDSMSFGQLVLSKRLPLRSFCTCYRNPFWNEFYSVKGLSGEAHMVDSEKEFCSWCGHTPFRSRNYTVTLSSIHRRVRDLCGEQK